MKVVVLVLCIVVGILSSDAQDCDHQIVCQRLRQEAEDACAAHDFREGVVIGRKGEKGDLGETVVVDCERIMQNIKQLHTQEINALLIQHKQTKETFENLNESLASFAEDTEREINTLMIKDNETMTMIEKLNKSNLILKAEKIKKDEEIGAMIIKENVMIATIERLNASIASLKDEYRKKKQEFCKVYYEGKCFWFVKRRVTYSQGEGICSRIPAGHVAIIRNDENYQQILDYMRRSFLTVLRTYLDAWIGVRFDPESGQVVTLPGETEAPFKKWYPNFPFVSPPTTYTHIMLQVNVNASHPKQGMHHYLPWYTADGVLCEA